MKTNENTVLSFSHDPNLLFQREAALRSGGFKVISVKTENQARFEIETGRCGGASDLLQGECRYDSGSHKAIQAELSDRQHCVCNESK
jgi:hypothetical protein